MGVKERRESVLDEAERQAQRAGVRRRLAATQLAELRHERLLAIIENASRDKERAADEHSALCTPIQIELKKIDVKQVAAILAGGQPDDLLESKRRELLDTLTTLNNSLEERIAAADEQIEKLEVERREVARGCHRSALLTELLALGKPELLKRLRLARLRQIAASEAEVLEQILAE